ncbi:cyclic nucleotide-binding domain-containing protein [Telmatospirillum sp.]|uniref:cyclic nucleotide-binding domain-containing protein n=1 Tax=Telmatospirillum sp. TaxID=2079197 RepID=UPI00284B67B5|nr:cyclic nucleotide-binding domain-containing protein [Telmatospirillum sp.]MDR3441345.1 cyclic nucleotide-binding domain-containing protein [Telmatospirillum sp.]
MTTQDDSRKAFIPERRSFPAHTTIFKEGELADCAYIVETGDVQITKVVNGRRVLLGTLHPWEMFGELGLIDASPRMASATTLNDTVCMVVSKAAMAQMMDDAPQGLNTIIHSLVQIVRTAGIDLAEARYQLLEREKSF